MKHVYAPSRPVRRAFLATLAATAASLGSAQWSPAAAQSAWPFKPIRIVCAFPPGNSSDVMARVLSDQLQRRLGQPVVVENKPGASGIIAAQAVQSAPPDGYTLLMTSTSFIINRSVLKNVPYEVTKDFTGISLINSIPAVLVVDKSFPPRDMKELLAEIKSKPGKYSYGHPGTGTIQNLSMKLFLQEIDGKVLEVPYKGSVQAITDIQGGQLHMMWDAANAAYTQVQSGRMRALATTAPTRYSLLPEVPTLKELGVNVSVVGFTVLMAPAGTPPDITEKLNAAIKSILETPEAAARVKGMGLEVYPHMGPAQVSTWLAEEGARWEKVARAAHINKE